MANVTTVSTQLPNITASTVATTVSLPNTTVTRMATNSTLVTTAMSTAKTTISTIATTTSRFITTTAATTTTTAEEISNSSASLMLLSLVLFGVAVALVLKVVLSHRKKRKDLIGGTARWRLAATQQPGAGPQQTAATYAPMSDRSGNGLDRPGPDRLDWERQFFDENETTVPSRLHLDFSRTGRS